MTVDLGLLTVSSVVAFYLIEYFFFKAEPSEQDGYYLRGGVTKMVTLKGKPVHVGGKYWLYTAVLAIPDQILGADMRKISIGFDYVADQEVEIDKKKNGRYTVENFGTKGSFQFVEIEGSDIEKILRRNADREKPFEFNIKGPFGNYGYKGKGQFFE